MHVGLPRSRAGWAERVLMQSGVHDVDLHTQVLMGPLAIGRWASPISCSQAVVAVS
jgi:hypothetical protein